MHLVIDAGVDSEAIHQRMKAAKGIEASDIPPDSLAKTASIANAYWFAHQQTRDGWTHEHKKCGKLFNPVMVCSECGEPLHPKEVVTLPGPGARPAPDRTPASNPAKAGRRAA